MYVCPQAAFAPYRQHWCECVCECAREGEKKALLKMCAFDRVRLDSNYLCFSLPVTHARSFQELRWSRVDGDSRQCLVGGVWRNEEVVLFLCAESLDLVNFHS